MSVNYPQIPEALHKKAEDIFFRYPPEHREAGLVPLMFEAQKVLGFISPETEHWLAEQCHVSLVKVREVLTFYSMMRSAAVGKYLIQYCQNISCCLMGGEAVLAHLEQKLGIHAGQTTPDKLFTLRCVECLGGCSWGPMLLVNEDQYYQLTPAKIDKLIDGFKSGNPVVPDNPTPLLGNVGEVAEA
ncbi:NAD(P)H-dependent oxidoreductase subunit E [candidate division KSB1 bacterium]|nr:NAD(P)H-dependent oxidoreductase subunit E [candidate division KSB1 bacterium]